ncbi:DUF5908 family protein [Ekhidna sp.]
MPLEIRESIIRINVLDKSNSEEDPEKNNYELDADLIIKECVEQVLELLKEQNER